MTTGAGAPIETELKFEVQDPKPIRKLLDSEELNGLPATGPLVTVEVEDRYFDTEGRALEAAGRVARLRRTGDDTLVTVKSLAVATDGPVHRREEIEGPATIEQAPAQWPPSDARAIVMELAGDAPLVELVTIKQRRQVRPFGNDEVGVEVSLDRVSVLRHGRSIARFVELEAELRSGDEARLTALGAHLATAQGLAPARQSKLQRALAALERAEREATRPHLMVGATPGVSATDTLAEAGRKVLAFHFERLLAREPGTREGRDIEELHQMRVATRRLRAAWRVFGDAFDPADAKRLKRPLRVVAAALGAVRDLDVLLEIARAYQVGLPEPEGVAFGALIRDLEARREAARQQLDDVLDQPRYGRWLHASVAFLGSPRRPSKPAATAEPRLVRELAPAAIWAAFGRVLAYEGIQRWADVPTLHALRIEGKRLRYSLEFVREALGPEVNPLIQRVTAMQDHLGLLNDADVAATMARDFLSTRSAELSAAERAAVGAFIVDRDRELRRLHRTAGRPWRSVSGILFRRRLGRVLAGL